MPIKVFEIRLPRLVYYIAFVHKLYIFCIFFHRNIKNTKIFNDHSISFRLVLRIKLFVQLIKFYLLFVRRSLLNRVFKKSEIYKLDRYFSKLNIECNDTQIKSNFIFILNGWANPKNDIKVFDSKSQVLVFIFPKKTLRELIMYLSIILTQINSTYCK